MLTKLLPVRLWWTGFILIAVLGVAIYFITARPVSMSITDQTIQQEKTITKAEASNLSSFFQVFGESVAAVAGSSSMRSRDTATQDDLDALIGQWADTGLVSTVILTNQAGVVIFSSDITGAESTGTDLSDRDWFSWAKNQGNDGKYIVGHAVVGKVSSAKGQVIAPVASPVYEKGVFLGVVAAAVKVAPLTAHYLNILKISNQSDTYLIGNNGDLLFSSISGVGAPGSSIFQTQDGKPFLGSQSLSDSIKNALNQGAEGTLTTDQSLITYSPVAMGNRNWLLIMVSPIQEITNVTTPIHIRQISSLILVALTVILFGILAVRESRGQEAPNIKTSEKSSAEEPQKRL